MKSLLIPVAGLAIGLSVTAAHAQYAGPSDVRTMTVKELLATGRDDQHAALQGRIVNHLGGDNYEFADATGKIRVEIDNDLWAGHPVIDDKRTVKITGELERKVMGRVGFDVDRIDVLP